MMFVRDFIEIALPFEAVAPRLVRNADWLGPIAHHAVEETVATLTALQPDQPVLFATPLKVHCARGPVRIRVDALVMPLRWESNIPESLLPAVDGDLEVVPIGADRSQVALSVNSPISLGNNDAVTR